MVYVCDGTSGAGTAEERRKGYGVVVDSVPFLRLEYGVGGRFVV